MHYILMALLIEKTDEYVEWFDEQTKKRAAQIEKRLKNVADHEHFGTTNKLSANMAEIKFNDGTRIYFAVKTQPTRTVILLLGGNKNGQSYDIAQAQAILDRRP